ncbi:MAG: DnaJ domain-containing protein [Halolamina sp.]
MPTDLYDVLGAPDDASSEELKRAYRSRVREYHPDVNDHPDGDAQFKLIREAHDVLSDPAERKDYDRMGHREYVEKRLDDVPPVSVFPEAGSTVDSSPAGDSSTGEDSTRSESRRRSEPSTTGRTASTKTGSTATKTTGTSGNRSESAGASTAKNTSGSGHASRRGERSTAESQSTGTGRSNPAAGTERSDSAQWDDVAGQSGSRTRSTRSTGPSAAARRRRGLRRWYGVVLLSLLAYFGGVGAYATPHADALNGLVRGLTASPAATLSATFQFPSPTAYVLGAVSAAASGAFEPGLLLLVGVVSLPVVVLTAVAQFGQGSAWVYALASLGPVLCLAALRFVALPTAVALLALVVLPLFSGLGFLVDVGRYLWATR